MRRRDREITDLEELLAVIRRCDVCRLGFACKNVPYLVPLNFGMEQADETVILYFHGAPVGKKAELIHTLGLASFEMDCAHRLVTNYDNNTCTMEYESVIGWGTIEQLTEDSEKIHGLSMLMKQYPIEDCFVINPAVASKTAVWKLTVQEMTGKQRKISLT
jgi:nitroimidazol reductase NimA-like FMN-containing flavoprotein (pyridoxamine 5'-phosphate oxidase superfamily)